MNTALGQIIVSGSKIGLWDNLINERPNWSSNGWFPSWHTYAAIAWVEYLSKKCINKNWKYAPHLLAAFTWWSREISKNHSAEQVLMWYLLWLFIHIEDENRYIGLGAWEDQNWDISTGL